MAKRKILLTLFVVLLWSLPARAEQAASPDSNESGASSNVRPTDATTKASESGNRKATRGRTFGTAGFLEPGSYQDSITRGLGWLQEQGLLINLDVALLDQYASRVRQTPHNATTFAWSLFGEYEAFTFKNAGSLLLAANVLGSVGLGYNTNVDPLSVRTGSLTLLDANIYPDGIGIDQIYLQYISEHAEFSLALGRIDTSDFFDTNNVAGDSFRQFFAFTFQNGASIPYPVYGGFGLLARWQPTKNIYVIGAVGDATSNSPVRFRSILDGAWWELLEVGVTTRLGSLGQGTYRLTGWLNDAGPGNGQGISLNVEQRLGHEDLVAFLRLGTGSRNQTAVHASAAGGLSWQAPGGRKNDQAGLGVSWADPSAAGPNEILVEGYYRWALTRRISVSPDLQLLFNPVIGPKDKVVVVGGLRLTWAS